MLTHRAIQFHQIAYVTTDLERAKSLFREHYGVARFFMLCDPPPDNIPPGIPPLRVALANLGGTEVELIQPLGRELPVFADALPRDKSFALRFHHICFRIAGDLADWNAHRASIDEGEHRVAFHGALEDDLRFLYTDERSRLGHYVEHIWMSPKVLQQMAQAVPSFPEPVA
jgi:hypothetical protein